MAEVIPLKIAPGGSGTGELREFSEDDRLPKSVLPLAAQFASITLNSPTDTLINGGETHAANTPGAAMSVARNDNMTSEYIVYSNAPASMARFQMLKARGTAAAPAIVAAEDYAGVFQFFAHGGDTFRSIGGVFGIVDGTPVANSYVPGRVEFRTTFDAATGPRTVWQFRAAGHLQPGADNAYDLGSASLRPRVIYASTGAISVSDAREKTSVRTLTAGEIAAAKQLAGEIGAYRFLSALGEKGGAAREHIGMTVQRAIEVMKGHGLDPFDYGFICFDEWDERVELVGGEDDHAPSEIKTPAGDRYSFRVDELCLFLVAGLEARMAVLEKNT